VRHIQRREGHEDREAGKVEGMQNTRKKEERKKEGCKRTRSSEKK
jgi:hypothetical protein